MSKKAVVLSQQDSIKNQILQFYFTRRTNKIADDFALAKELLKNDNIKSLVDVDLEVTEYDVKTLFNFDKQEHMIAFLSRAILFVSLIKSFTLGSNHGLSNQFDFASELPERREYAKLDYFTLVGHNNLKIKPSEVSHSLSFE